jgi:hypothetical protein
VFNVLKDSTGISKRIIDTQKQFQNMGNEQSDINDLSDNEDIGEEDHLVQNILNRFRNDDRSSLNNQEEQPESEDSNEEHEESEADIDESEPELIELPKPVDFHQKTPLSIDIVEPENEEDEEEVIVLNSKGEPLNENDALNYKEDGKSNHSPWISKAKGKLSPFQNFRKRLIINTDSLDSGNSTKNKILKQSQDPPATLTTNATTNKHTEPLFLKGIPSRSANSKNKAEGIKSLEQIDDEYFEILRKKHDDPYHNQAKLEENNLENDLIVEEDHE